MNPQNEQIEENFKKFAVAIYFSDENTKGNSWQLQILLIEANFRLLCTCKFSYSTY